MDAGERVHDMGIKPLPFHKGDNGCGGPFRKSIICNFMVYHERIETNLLQIFAHPGLD